MLFPEIIKKAFTLGAKYGRVGAVRFDITESTFLSPGAARKSLKPKYKDLVSFWSPILKKANTLGILVYYTDLGKDKINNRALVNICASFTLPSLPDHPITLVLCTKVFKSVILELAQTSEEKDNVDMSDLAEECFQKNAINIRNTFEFILQTVYGIDVSCGFIVCDRAAENVKAFGKRYICC